MFPPSDMTLARNSIEQCSRDVSTLFLADVHSSSRNYERKASSSTRRRPRFASKMYLFDPDFLESFRPWCALSLVGGAHWMGKPA